MLLGSGSTLGFTGNEISARTPPPAVATRDGDGRVIAGRCLVVDRPWSRLRGLLGRTSMEADEGLLIEPCSSVHTFAMRFAVDVVFVDDAGRVLRVVEDLRPWRLAACRRSRKVLELAGGRAREVGLEIGDELRFETAATARKRS